MFLQTVNSAVRFLSMQNTRKHWINNVLQTLRTGNNDPKLTKQRKNELRFMANSRGKLRFTQGTGKAETITLHADRMSHVVQLGSFHRLWMEEGRRLHDSIVIGDRPYLKTTSISLKNTALRA
jgi:hypothetical protein